MTCAKTAGIRNHAAAPTTKYYTHVYDKNTHVLYTFIIRVNTQINTLQNIKSLYTC